jgi:hypothetical protein
VRRKKLDKLKTPMTNRTRDLSACGIVQQTTLPRAADLLKILALISLYIQRERLSSKSKSDHAPIHLARSKGRTENGATAVMSFRAPYRELLNTLKHECRVNNI